MNLGQPSKELEYLPKNCHQWLKTADSAKFQKSIIKTSFYKCNGRFWASYVRLFEFYVSFPNSVSIGSKNKAILHCGKVDEFEDFEVLKQESLSRPVLFRQFHKFFHLQQKSLLYWLSFEILPCQQFWLPGDNF